MALVLVLNLGLDLAQAGALAQTPAVVLALFLAQAPALDMALVLFWLCLTLRICLHHRQKVKASSLPHRT